MTRTHRYAALILCSLIFWACDSRAETTFGLHTLSVHTPQHTQNNTNPGAYVRIDRWQAGAYRNSDEHTTVYGSYLVPVGPLELIVGVATGYDKHCTTTTTEIPAKQEHAVYTNGDTSTTAYPARTVSSESCTGFSRHKLTPLAALSYAAPFEVLGARPRIWVMPGFGRVSTVAHLTLEWSIR